MSAGRTLHGRRRPPGRRIPFLGLVLAAVAGILLGSQGLAALWLAVAAAACLLVVAGGRCGMLIWPGVLLTFAALQAGSQQWAAGNRLLDLAGPTGGTATVEGVVLDTPRISASGRASCMLAVRSLHLPGSATVEVPGRLALRWAGPAPARGDLVRARGTLRAIPAPRNPGEFDFRRWQQARGIHAQLTARAAADCEVVATGRGNPVLALAERANRAVSQLLSLGISNHPTAAALLRAMTLGDASGLGEEWIERFRITGTLHLFSVSGLHVGMLALLLWFGLKPLGLPQPARILLIICLLFFYAAVTGLRPASLRAAFMASVVLAGLLLERPALPLNSLCAAAFLLLLFDSNWLFHPGFQLSFLVVVSILVLGSPLQRRLRDEAGPDAFLPRKLYRWPEHLHAWCTRSFGALAAVSVSAWLGSLPLIAAYYHLVSLSAIPVNILAVPLAFCVLAVALLSLVGGSLLPFLADVFNHANLLLATLLLGLVQTGAGLPLSSVRLGQPRPTPAPVEAVVFDVGAGGAMALHLGRRTYLIDTGSSYQWETVVWPYLRSLGIGRLGGLFLTHGDSQHLGGARAAIERLEPRFVAVGPARDRSRVFRALQQWMEASGIPKRILRAGDRLPLAEGWRADVLYPPAGIVAPFADDKGLVLKFSGPGPRILVLGDAGVAVEDWLLENNPGALAAELLVVGRHVSGQPGRAEFLDAVAPLAVVAAHADFPRSAQIPASWEAVVRQRQIPLYRQDRTGAVRIEFGPRRGLRIQPFLESRQPAIGSDQPDRQLRW